MCGFSGVMWQHFSDDESSANAILKDMTDAIAHRGPDGVGYWLNREQGIGFGHRRLSIVDLSPAGQQPMLSASNRYVLVFNGEIYNHLILRKSLNSTGKAPRWRGHSDTETLLAGFDAWGIQNTINHAIGMFAIAVWDRSTCTLTLGRDRLGEKPLYYGWQGQGDNAAFLFGSELKALRAHPAFAGKINRGALCLQLRHNYIPAPYSIYQNIFKLLPGSLLTISLTQREPVVKSYWSGTQTAEHGIEHPFQGTDEQAVNELELLLKNTISRQMIADVPIGAFLSGGVDSSAVVALMQSQSSRPVKTFTIGFHESMFNEAEHAKAVATHLGTEHTVLYVSAEQAMAVIPRLPALYDEPFSDSSQIPTFLISQLARQHVTVALSGDAGDELFCGYNRYQLTAGLWERLTVIPPSLRKLTAQGLTCIPPQSWDAMAETIRRVLPDTLPFANVGDKIHKGASVLGSKSCDALYFSLVSHWNNPASVVINGDEPPTLLTGNAPMLTGLNSIQRMMALDMVSYLPDDILVKVDRAAMAASLETRVPFLDHRIVEFAWSLPQSMKLRDRQTKWALRQVLYRYVPRELIERPKMGFGVPVGDWLRGALRDWAEALLDESRLRREGFFQAMSVRLKWEEHLSGRRNWQYHLWDILMFQAWLENQ